MYNNKYVLIIDSFRSHNSLVFRCSSQNFIPIHIFSSKKVFEENFSVVTNNMFFKSFIFDNINTLSKDLEEYKNNIQFVFSCSDGGQPLKDIIDDLLNLSTKNSSTFAIERYNKFALYQLLGQPSADRDFKKFIKEHDECVIKPSPMEHSGGCLDVAFVNSQSTAVEDKENFFISKFFNGNEYAVDFVSCNGKHKLVSVWQYTRNDKDKIWKDNVELIHYDENPQLIQEIYNVATSWFDRIEHRYGPIHLEIKSKGNQFFCVEMNFRLHGHVFYGSLAKWLTNTQTDLTIDCYTEGKKFSGNLVTYAARGYVNKIYLTNSYSDRPSTDVDWHAIETHPSVDRVFRHVWPWENLPVSQKTYQSSAAIVTMSNASKDVLADHVRNIKKLFDQRSQGTV